MDMGNFLSKNPDMDGYGSGRTGWSGVGLRILPREGLFTLLDCSPKRNVLGEFGRVAVESPVSVTSIIRNNLKTRIFDISLTLTLDVTLNPEGAGGYLEPPPPLVFKL